MSHKPTGQKIKTTGNQEFKTDVRGQYMEERKQLEE